MYYVSGAHTEDDVKLTIGARADAVDVECHAGDEACGRRSQEHGRPGDVLGLAPALHRRAAHHGGSAAEHDDPSPLGILLRRDDLDPPRCQPLHQGARDGEHVRLDGSDAGAEDEIQSSVECVDAGIVEVAGLEPRCVRPELEVIAIDRAARQAGPGRIGGHQAARHVAATVQHA